MTIRYTAFLYTSIGATFDHVTFQNNMGYRSGGAVAVSTLYGRIAFMDSTFIGNQALAGFLQILPSVVSKGGAISVNGVNNLGGVTIARCVFVNNSLISGYGGATGVSCLSPPFLYTLAYTPTYTI